MTADFIIEEDNDTLIELENITIEIGGRYVFENTSLKIKKGQYWAITGENGSGKTVLIKALTRQIPVVRGRILYYFEDGDKKNLRAREYLNRGEIIIISPDSQSELMHSYSSYYQARWHSFEGENAPAAGEFLTGENIEHISPYEVTPLKFDENYYWERRESILKILGINDILNRKLIALSNGEARKILIAKAWMQSPRLLIFDDPFSGLDIDAREALENAIEDMISTGKTSIMIVSSEEPVRIKGLTHMLHIENKNIEFFGKTEDYKPETNKYDAKPAFPAVCSADTLVENKRSGCNDEAVLVEMNDVSVKYGNNAILNNINWKIKINENWLVTGHNGAGKTTLLSLITADNPQSYSNDITIFGKRRGSGESIWEIKEKIGWLSPELHLFYESGLTCLDVVCTGFFDTIGNYNGVGEIQLESARGVMNLLEIGNIAEMPYSGASFGESRIVLLARALVKKPLLLILDEPLHGLDMHYKTLILSLLDEICGNRNISLVYVTHCPDEIPASITHILRLEKGNIAEICEKKR